MIRFIAHGNPVPKQSFRYAEGGGYTEARVKAWAGYVASCAWEVKPADLLTVPLVVHLAFRLPTKRRVDADNLSKNVLDALKGVLWVDDQQVVDLHITKEVVGKLDSGVTVEVAEVTTKEDRKARAQRVATRVEELTQGEGRGVALALFAHALMMECDWRKVEEMERYIMKMVEA